MISRQEFIDMVADEVRICQHLATKLDPAKLDYSPSEGQRNTLDLMRYLTICGSGPATALIANDWSGVGAMQEAASTMPAEEFSARMDAQMAEIRTALEAIPEAEFATRKSDLPWGATVSLGAGLVQTTLRFISAYRLQLFVHAKSSGASDISTHNAWMGIDKPAE